MNRKTVGMGLILFVLILAGLGWYFWKPQPLMTVEQIQKTAKQQRLQLKEADATIERWKELRQKYETQPPSSGE